MPWDSAPGVQRACWPGQLTAQPAHSPRGADGGAVQVLAGSSSTAVRAGPTTVCSSGEGAAGPDGTLAVDAQPVITAAIATAAAIANAAAADARRALFTVDPRPCPLTVPPGTAWCPPS